MNLTKYDLHDKRKSIMELTAAKRYLRPEFKFPDKIEMAFSQPSHINAKQVRNWF